MLKKLLIVLLVLGMTVSFTFANEAESSGITPQMEEIPEGFDVYFYYTDIDGQPIEVDMVYTYDEEGNQTGSREVLFDPANAHTWLKYGEVEREDLLLPLLDDETTDLAVDYESSIGDTVVQLLPFEEGAEGDDLSFTPRPFLEEGYVVREFLVPEGADLTTLDISSLSTFESTFEWDNSVDGEYPTAIISIGESTGARATLDYTMKSGDTESLVNYSILYNDGVSEAIDTMHFEGFSDETLESSGSLEVTRNGVYAIKVTSANGLWRQEIVEVNSLDGTGVDVDEESTEYDENAPRLTISELPKSVAFGESFTLRIESDKKATIDFDGEIVEEMREAEFEVWGNGEYVIKAFDEDGNMHQETLVVDIFEGQELGEDNSWTMDEEEREGFFNGEAMDVEDFEDGGRSGLPQTGGFGMMMMTFGGIGVASGGAVLYKKKAISWKESLERRRSKK